MSQKLILPMPAVHMTAAYKNEKYRELWGFGHYGVDLIHPDKVRNVYAVGDGEVIACGMDGRNAYDRLGNCIVIVYRDVQRSDGVVCDLACRMFHFASITTKPGDKVKAGDLIGVYGNTGAKTSGPHLHIEFDTDIEWPQYAYGIASSGNIIKVAATPIDSTVNPSMVWYRDKAQSITGYGQGWTSDADIAIPTLETDSELEELRRECDRLRSENEAMTATINAISELIERYA